MGDARSMYDRVKNQPDDLCLKVDKQDGRISWLYFDSNLSLRSHRDGVATMEPRIGFDTLRTTVEESRYVVTVEEQSTENCPL